MARRCIDVLDFLMNREIDMGQRKGCTKSGGRKLGSPNRATAEARETIANFANGNVHRLQAWLDEVAKTDPARAFALFQSVIEYHVPKLARTDLTSNGKPLPANVVINVVGK